MKSLLGAFFHPNLRPSVKEISKNRVDLETGYELIRKERDSSSWPNLYYETLDTIIELSQPDSILEIGVAYGWHAEHILRKFPKIKYFGVDPYLAHYDSNDHFPQDVWSLLGGGTQQESLDLLYELVSTRLSNLYKDRFNLFRTTSDDFFSIPREKYDFIFIDGNHKYENVIRDLSSAWSCLTPGGVLCGDDFLWADVRLAVTNFSLNEEVEPVLLSNFKNEYPVYLFKKRVM